jgi:hypothetical protein
LSKEIYVLLGLSGYARLDYRVTPDDNAYLLEANPNPQIARDEDFARSAKHVGLDYEELIQRLLTYGISRAASRPLPSSTAELGFSCRPLLGQASAAAEDAALDQDEQHDHRPRPPDRKSAVEVSVPGTATLFQDDSKRGLASPLVHSALPITRRSQLQLSGGGTQAD